MTFALKNHLNVSKDGQFLATFCDINMEESFQDYSLFQDFVEFSRL